MRWAWLGVTLVLLVLHEDGALGQVFSEPITDAATSGPSDVAFAEAGAASMSSAEATAGEEDDEEAGEPGPDGVVLGGNMKQAYNLFEHRVPVVPTPLSPSPFVEHPVPSDGQNLYPTSHTYSQLTLTPDNGEVKPNAGDGVAATTMPWQYRPYIKQEKLNRYVEPLVYKSMYSWTPSAPGKGDVSVQDAIATARDMFKPKDWKVRIEQKGANVEITRRGPDWYLGGGGNNGAQIARPTMPPEFYQFSAPTPPLFHSPVPPAPRKGHSNPALKGPSIYPTSAMAFLEETVDVTPAVPTATTSAAPVPAATTMVPPQSSTPTAPTPTPAAPAAKPAAKLAELSAPASELDAMTARLAQRIRVYQSQLRAARDAADLAVHNAYSAALKDHSAVVAAHRNVAAARAVSAHQKWAKVNAELDALPHERYDALKQEYRGLQGRPYDSYKRLRAALQRHRDNLSNPAPYDPYDRYADLHTALYGSAPPRFAQQRATRSATEAEAESAAMVMAAEAEVAAAETDAEWNNAGAETELGFSTGAPPAEFMAAEEDAAITAAFAADAIDADAAIDAPLSTAVPAHGVNGAVAAIADAATEEETAAEVATAVAAAAVADAELAALSKDVTPRAHIPLFYPSVRAAMRRAAAARAL